MLGMTDVSFLFESADNSGDRVEVRFGFITHFNDIFYEHRSLFPEISEDFLFFCSQFFHNRKFYTQRYNYIL